jgi:hypothetical protein
MINLHLRRIAASSAILIMLAGTLAIPAAARPLEPDRPGPTRTIAVSDSSPTCPLRRIDDQLVRCAVHVSALRRKFGVSGRGDLSAAVQSSEAGLPPYGSTR